MEENKETEKKVGLYIPPHRRKNPVSQPLSTNTVKPQEAARAGHYFTPHRPWHTKTTSASLSHATAAQPLSAHALKRKEERGISADAIQAVYQKGEKMRHPASVTHIDEKTQVVMDRKNETAITVMENKRNTKFDLLSHTKIKEQQLLKDIEKSSKNDHALCALAELYLSGDLGNREVKKAYDLLLKAARFGKGNSHAMCLLAQLYDEGDLGEPDPQRASEWMEKAALRGNRYALAVMGQRYLSEYIKTTKASVPEKEIQEKQALLKKAQFYLRKSADKGSTRAMWSLALIYERGWFGEKDMKRAIDIYTQAAKLGSPNSLYSLDSLRLFGEISSETFEAILDEASQLVARTSSQLAVTLGWQQIKGELGKKPERGFMLLEGAAQNHNEQAIKSLAKLYQKGKYCPVDLAKSQFWWQTLHDLYEKAAEEGNVNAMLDLGAFFLKGCLGKIDLDKAEAWFIKAAKTGDMAAMRHLGRLYKEGQLGNKNPLEGKGWIEKVIALCMEKALEGDEEAANDLVDIYLDKTWGFKNPEEAEKWLIFLTDKGYEEAWLDLATLRLKGKIFSIDDITLIAALEKAQENTASQWRSKTLRLLGNFYEKRKDNVKALEWYEEAVKLGNSKAMYRLGQLYETEGPEKLLKSIEYYTLSAQKGNQKALKRLNALELPAMEKNLIEATLKELPEETSKGNDYYEQGKREEATGHLLEAAFYYRKGKAYGHLEATFALAQLYEKGYLGEHVRPVALTFYKQAAKENHHASIKALINIYKEGFLVPFQAKKIEKWETKEKSIEEKNSRLIFSGKS